MHFSLFSLALVLATCLGVTLTGLPVETRAASLSFNPGPNPEINFRTLHHFANLSSAAYEAARGIRGRHPGSASSVTRVASPGKTQVQYFIEQDTRRRTQTIAVRGTVNDTNEELNLKTQGVSDKKAGVLVHKGFHAIARTLYRDLTPHLNRNYETYLTGHSMGGAVAAILTLYLRKDGFKIGGLYTYGQPKFTDVKGSRALRGLPYLRVVYQNDVIPKLPGRMRGAGQPYAHFGTELVLLAGPHFALLSEAEGARNSVFAYRKRTGPVSLPDHKIALYLRALKPKFGRTKRVSYKNMQKFVKRNRLGKGDHLPPIRRKSNFNRN